MLVVRYVALVALVFWVGDLAGGLVAPDALRPFPALAQWSAVVAFVSLFVMKFVGPPPPGFVLRAATIVAMGLLELSARVLVERQSQEERVLLFCTLVPGLSLLFWYVRE